MYVGTYTYKESVYLHTHNMYSRTQVDENTLNSKSVILRLRGINEMLQLSITSLSFTCLKAINKNLVDTH